MPNRSPYFIQLTRNPMNAFIPALIFALWINPAGQEKSIPALYKSRPGPYRLKTVETFMLHDARRGKDLPLRITFPDSGQHFPVIIWSHGALGSKDNYQPLIRRWASWGYVCIQPTHEDSWKWLGWRALLNRKQIWRKWPTRPADISLVIDSLVVLAKRVPGLEGKMDRHTIGVGGHSFGAHTAQLIGGAALQGPGRGKKHRFSDDRPRAILLISPQGTGDGFTPASWKEMKRPVMVITGTNDTSPRNGKSYSWRTEVYRYAPPGDKFLIIIKGAYHGFGGIAGARRFKGSGPQNPQQVAMVQAATLAFWDAYLRDDAAARLYLKNKSLVEATAGAIEMKIK
ncbi:MAG: hypothetical protein D6814_15685 [Calditrichaeota bacterium]|nr:MAG: hypothetical protein D6814_15685 [Calditrichota bacterium]